MSASDDSHSCHTLSFPSRGTALCVINNQAADHAGDTGASLQRDYVGRSHVSPQGRNLGVFVEGHHVDNVYTLAGKDDLHVNGCFSAGHVQRHEVDSLLSTVPH